MISQDLVRVNIYNTGRIRWLNAYGPIKGATISKDIFNLLKKDPSIKMDLLEIAPPFKLISRINYTKNEPQVQEIKKVNIEVSSPEPSVYHKEEVILEPEVTPAIVNNIIEPKELNVILDSESDVENEEIDSAIDEAVENYNEEDFVVEYTEPEVKKYTEEELMELTRDGLRKILRERKFFSGPNAPKYHDTLEILRQKILKTQ